MKNRLREQLQEYMSFKFLAGFLLYPLLLAILPFKSVLTPVLSLGFAIIALIPIYKFIKEIFIDKEMTYKEKLIGSFGEKFYYYHFLLVLVLLIKGAIYAYFGIVYTIIGLLLLVFTLYMFIICALPNYYGKIWYFLKYTAPITISLIIGIVIYQLGLKGEFISSIIFAITFGVILVFAIIRIVKSFKYKSDYKDKRLSKVYLVFTPVMFITLSILMMHTYYVTQRGYFMAMLLFAFAMLILIIVLSIVTLGKKDKGYFKRNWSLYLFLIPAAGFALTFAYGPMLGILLAFKDYNIFFGDGPIDAFFLSNWVGFDHFRALFTTGDFVRALINTLLISTYKIAFVFPLPIFLAILINEVRHKFFKSSVQTIVYLPHFISWAIVGGIFYGLFAEFGPINSFLAPIRQLSMNLGFIEDASPIVWYNEPDLFRGVIVVSYAWKEVGYSAIVYLATIVGISPALYEAAKVDGADKLRQIWYVTLPGLAPTIAMLFVLRLGYLLEAGFDQIIVMSTDAVRSTTEIIGTYVYRIGLGVDPQFSFATAVGLFNSVIALTMILLGNFITKKFFNKGLW